mmetsp:Transcript_38455/g.101985  ORF Transcript_38455/g.101985 Transcript_38455/m.101985 type:complete len:114 (-) Transcript_38455:198-539(-)
MFFDFDFLSDPRNWEGALSENDVMGGSYTDDEETRSPLHLAKSGMFEFLGDPRSWEGVICDCDMMDGGMMMRAGCVECTKTLNGGQVAVETLAKVETTPIIPERAEVLVVHRG